MRLSSVLAPRDREFFDLFEEAGGNILRAADLLDQMLRDYPERGSDLARDILICEQDGDRITHDIIRRLNETFVTPIDREDIYALASALDDIVDYTEEVADYLGLYKIEAPMEQAQRLAHVLLDCARQIAEAMPRLRGFKDITHYTVEINRLENDGDRITREAIAALFDNGIDPMVVIRWKDIYERLEDGDRRHRARGQHPRGHRHQELLGVGRYGERSDHGDRRRHGAGVRLHQRLPRHGQRRGHVDLDPGDGAAARGRLRGDPQLRRRVPLARGGGHDGQRRSSTPTSITPLIVFAGLIGAIAWNLITWYFGLPVELLARADRRRRGRRVRGQGPGRASSATGMIGKVVVPALVAPTLAFVVARRGDPRCSTGSSGGCGPGRSRAASRSARSSPAGCWRSPTAPTTPRRRWA